ncbi:glycosyltransferase family A protein [Thalassotalea fonticola]|uniref:Glycosyltransferase family A protein n=1 Tax=Thalassotalea fonticola TaxID=3065649 RepID=A0ABZ0GTR0_9GAMM|nr:glycosyltransferase family A protein [Colwelliaceae bacterium S1-1]
MNYSVVIPIYNSSTTLQRTLNSVLSQNVPPNAIILVDDRSSDLKQIKAIVSKIEICTLIEKSLKSNAAHSRNIGWEYSLDEVVFFIDSDDEWLPNHTEVYLNYFKENIEIECVYGSFINVFTNQENTEEFIVQDYRQLNCSPSDFILKYNNDFRTSTLALRRNVIDKVKFDDKAFKHQDWDFFFSLAGASVVFKCSSLPTVHLNCFGNHRMSASNNLRATLYFIDKWEAMLTNTHYSKIFKTLMLNSITRKDEIELKTIYKEFVLIRKIDIALKLKWLCVIGSVTPKFTALSVRLLRNMLAHKRRLMCAVN